MKKLAFLALICLLTACSSGNATETSESSLAASESAETSFNAESTPASSASDESAASTQSSEDASTAETDAEITSSPTTNAELYALFVQEWKKGDVTSLYAYSSDILKSMFDEEAFQFMFCGNFPVFGKIKGIENEQVLGKENNGSYCGTLIFENAKADFQLALDHLQISGFYYDLRIEKPFDVTLENGVTEHYFPLQSGDFTLNAAYVKAAKENAPTALLIPGSGPSDYNETIGILPTFQDLARELAGKGISSLRIEKRTFHFASECKNTDTLEEEYFTDLNSAITWLENENPSSELWYLGHSLGVNIAAELISRHPAKGLILWNGTARHLADVAADQYAEQAPAFASTYRGMAENAAAVTEETAKGTNFFSCPDYYWASYNKLTTLKSIRDAHVPTLILNSLLDRQIFEVDRKLWQESFGKDDFVKIRVFEDQSHAGYKLDAKTANYYQLAVFPEELTDEIADFIFLPPKD